MTSIPSVAWRPPPPPRSTAAPAVPRRSDGATWTPAAAGPEWSRLMFDPRRDRDPLEWLGFTTEPV